ncbi:MAG: dienelactone hydrolase family protein [Sandaracinaceae bacterium]
MTHQLLPYTEGDDTFDAYLVRPSGPGPHPAVLICHAWGGRDEFAENKAKAIAELGYVGAAIDVYGVGKRGTDTASNQALMMPLLHDPAMLRRRLTAAYQAVRTADGVDPDKMATIGFCFGGLCSILTGRMGLDLRGVVAFHGLLKIGEQLDPHPKAQFLILHGQDDPMVPTEDLAGFAAEMKRIDARWTLEAYPGVQHAFTVPGANDDQLGLHYNAQAAARSWLSMKRFLGDVFE